MTNTEPLFTAFLNDVKPTQTLWALQDKSSEDWVVLDSSQFENTDVMPVWSSEELAKVHCVDEWQSYRPTKITVADWLEFWVEDLSEDGVMIGVNWQEDGECLELELAEFSQGLGGIETL